MLLSCYTYGALIKKEINKWPDRIQQLPGLAAEIQKVKSSADEAVRDSSQESNGGSVRLSRNSERCENMIHLERLYTIQYTVLLYLYLFSNMQSYLYDRKNVAQDSEIVDKAISRVRANAAATWPVRCTCLKRWRAGKNIWKFEICQQD